MFKESHMNPCSWMSSDTLSKLFLTLAFQLRLSLVVQHILVIAVHLHKLWLHTQRVTTEKSAYNNVSWLKSIRSGFGLFRDVLVCPARALVAKQQLCLGSSPWHLSHFSFNNAAMFFVWLMFKKNQEGLCFISVGFVTF